MCAFDSNSGHQLLLPLPNPVADAPHLRFGSLQASCGNPLRLTHPKMPKITTGTLHVQVESTCQTWTTLNINGPNEVGM